MPEMFVVGLAVFALLALAAGGAMLPTAVARLEFAPVAAFGLASAATPVAGRLLGRPAVKIRRARRSHCAAPARRAARRATLRMRRKRLMRGKNWRTGA